MATQNHNLSEYDAEALKLKGIVHHKAFFRPFPSRIMRKVTIREVLIHLTENGESPKKTENQSYFSHSVRHFYENDLFLQDI